MNLPESQLYPPVRDWLKSKGYIPHAEVGRCDVVGIENLRVIRPRLFAIELKTSCTKTVFYQAGRTKLFADMSAIAVGSNPSAKSINKAKQLKLGLLWVTAGQVTEVVPAQLCEYAHETWWERRKAAMVEHLGNRKEDASAVAGIPTLKGSGPAQKVQKLVTEYMREHPRATWLELYKTIPNHYAHYKSMSQHISK